MAEVCMLSLCGGESYSSTAPACCWWQGPSGGPVAHSLTSHPLPARRRIEILVIYAVSPKFANPEFSQEF